MSGAQLSRQRDEDRFGGGGGADYGVEDEEGEEEHGEGDFMREAVERKDDLMHVLKTLSPIEGPIERYEGSFLYHSCARRLIS